MSSQNNNSNKNVIPEAKNALNNMKTEIANELGLTNYEMLAGKRKFVILAVVVIAAFLTPPDVVSQIMLSIPILLLFEISLLICKVVKPKAEQQEV